LTSCLAPELVGAQRPRILAVPPEARSSQAAEEAIELAAESGLILDDWQQFALRTGLAEDHRGLYAAFEVCAIVARQNGKGGIFEARELFGLFLAGEPLIIHSAHRFDTSLEAFLRMLVLIESNPDLDRRIKRVSRSHGEEGFETRTGQRLRYKTRTGSGGRGFSGRVVILDEGMYLPEGTMSALMPTMSAQFNPQLWYGASAVDQNEHEHGKTLTRVRNRALAGNDPSLAYMEWSPDVTMEQVEKGEVDLSDIALALEANPAAGIRIPIEQIKRERRSMTRRSYAVERLSIGDWPNVAEEGPQVIDPDVWAKCVDASSAPTDPVAFGVSMTEDRSRTVIAVAGRRPDGRFHGEIVDDGPGSAWALPRLLELIAKWDPCAIVIDKADAAATLAVDLADDDVEPELLTVGQFVLACGGFYDDVTGDRFRFRGDELLTAAVGSAAKRRLGGAWAWDRTAPGFQAPLIAVTAARHGVVVHGKPVAAPPAPRSATPEANFPTSETADLARAGF